MNNLNLWSISNTHIYAVQIRTKKVEPGIHSRNHMLVCRNIWPILFLSIFFFVDVPLEHIAYLHRLVDSFSASRHGLVIKSVLCVFQFMK
jgi:hypothetical protein